MSESSASKLYSPDLLARAVSLANYPIEPNTEKQQSLTLRGEARSRSCGSALELGLALDEHQTIGSIGLRVTACAVGQAAAAIFAEGAKGQDAASLAASLDEIERWLAKKGDIPTWPDFAALAPALPHLGRHDAIKLAWQAGLMAFSHRAELSKETLTR